MVHGKGHGQEALGVTNWLSMDEYSSSTKVPGKGLDSHYVYFALLVLHCSPKRASW